MIVVVMSMYHVCAMSAVTHSRSKTKEIWRWERTHDENRRFPAAGGGTRGRLAAVVGGAGDGVDHGWLVQHEGEELAPMTHGEVVAG